MLRYGLLCLAACGRVDFAPRAAAPDAAAALDADLACPSSYDNTPDGCYLLVATPKDWLGAELACEASGAHLIVIDDVPEHSLLHSMLTDASVVQSWMGYSDRRIEGAFAWVVSGAGVDPSTATCFWGTGGPAADGNSPANDCVIETAVSACPDWSIHDCAELQPYVCEHDNLPADPTRY